MIFFYIWSLISKNIKTAENILMLFTPPSLWILIRRLLLLWKPIWTSAFIGTLWPTFCSYLVAAVVSPVSSAALKRNCLMVTYKLHTGHPETPSFFQKTQELTGLECEEEVLNRSTAHNKYLFQLVLSARCLIPRHYNWIYNLL